MYALKKLVLRVILCAECITFAGFYFFGARGLPALRSLQQENKVYEQEITKLEDSLIVLQEEIAEWHAYPFYKEKVAREQLQLIFPGDTVYFIN